MYWDLAVQSNTRPGRLGELILAAQEYVQPALTPFLFDPTTLRSKLSQGVEQLEFLQGQFTRRAVSAGFTPTTNQEQLDLLAAVPCNRINEDTLCVSNQVDACGLSDLVLSQECDHAFLTFHVPFCLMHSFQAAVSEVLSALSSLSSRPFNSANTTLTMTHLETLEMLGDQAEEYMQESARLLQGSFLESSNELWMGALIMMILGFLTFVLIFFFWFWPLIRS